MLNDPHIVLAALADGTHVQVGPALSHNAAHSLFDALDASHQGWQRDERGRLHGGGTKHRHRILGQDVRFYRVRHVERATFDQATGRFADNIDREFAKRGLAAVPNLRHVGIGGPR